MRYFQTLPEALVEIRRDVYKSPLLDVTRVQQRTNQDLKARERLGYDYVLMGGIPETPEELVTLAIKNDFQFWGEHPEEMIQWLKAEREVRLHADQVRTRPALTELIHPALRTTIEGNWPSYTYRERLYGAIPTMVEILARTPDTRRAYWPIYQPQDAHRAMSPTRVPCSLGYEAVIRNVNGTPTLSFFYLQRSADLDTFFLSDVWLGREFQRELVQQIRLLNPDLATLRIGPFYHQIISFHSFFAAGEEIY